MAAVSTFHFASSRDPGSASLFAGSGRGITIGSIVPNFPGDYLDMGSHSFRSSASICARLILGFLLVTFCFVTANAQTKPERQSKAAKAAQQPAQSTPSTTASAI